VTAAVETISFWLAGRNIAPGIHLGWPYPPPARRDAVVEANQDLMVGMWQLLPCCAWLGGRNLCPTDRHRSRECSFNPALETVTRQQAFNERTLWGESTPNANDVQAQTGASAGQCAENSKQLLLFDKSWLRGRALGFPYRRLIVLKIL
jgi:hypothetical protein